MERICPYCYKAIDIRANKCPYCCSDLSTDIPNKEDKSNTMIVVIAIIIGIVIGIKVGKATGSFLLGLLVFGVSVFVISCALAILSTYI